MLAVKALFGGVIGQQTAIAQLAIDRPNDLARQSATIPASGLVNAAAAIVPQTRFFGDATRSALAGVSVDIAASLASEAATDATADAINQITSWLGWGPLR